ncbi:protein DCG1 [Lipomyces oligophaga]|uniref:protein DCG1 n=1 Tax=Lipomyces oligophaga TaxID=45792 RepID=UPI0034CE5002
MTQSLTSLISPQPGIEIDYFTAPPTAPPSINNSEEGLRSCQECMKKLDSNPEAYLKYDGYLVACYSDHPLIYELRNKSDIISNKAQIMGIFQASVLYALNSASEDRKIAILTSGKAWERILDEAIYKFFNGRGVIDQEATIKLPSFFLPTLSAGVDVLKLAEPVNYEILKARIRSMAEKKASVILLGCAGLATLDGKFSADFPDLTFVDSVKAGIELLSAHVKFASYLN